MKHWHDAKKEKPRQGDEVILLLDNGEQHAGYWLEHINKYRRNVCKWKVFKYRRFVREDKVIAWREINTL